MITRQVNNKEIKFYTAREVADIVNVDPRTVYRWIYAKKIESQKFDPDNPTTANYIPEYEIPTFLRKKNNIKK